MRELSVLLKKEEVHQPIVSELPSSFQISRNDKEKGNKPDIKTAKTDRTPVAAF